MVKKRLFYRVYETMVFSFPDPEEVTESFWRFRDFLNDAWLPMHSTLRDQIWEDDPYIIEDWLNDNWKHLFVRQLLGSTGGFQPLSISINGIQRGRHRYQFHTHVPSRCVFFALGIQKDSFSISPPFEQIQALNANGKIEVIPLSLVKFTLIENRGRRDGAHGFDVSEYPKKLSFAK